MAGKDPAEGFWAKKNSSEGIVGNSEVYYVNVLWRLR